MDYDVLKLDKQLCFPLYACARGIVKKYTPFLDEIGLTYTQYLVMLVLWEHEHVTAKELGEKLYLDSGTLTPLLKRLEAGGLLSRARSSADERSLIVTLTAKGRELKKAAAAIPAQLDACLNLPKEDCDALFHLLYKVLNHL